jgi:hypothetical protein
MINVEELHDIYGLSGVPFWKTSGFVWVLSTFLLIALFLGVFVIVRAYRRRAPKLIPYWECAHTELHQLHMQASLGHNKKLFYTQLTRILKSYLSNHYNESYQGKTDQEVGKHLARYSVVVPSEAQVIALFDEVTPVKFARSYDKKLEMVNDLQRAILFVQKTAPTGLR